MTDRTVKGSIEQHAAIARKSNPSQRPGKSEELAKTIKEFVKGNLSYENGANICVDVDTHFPLDEYPSRMKVVSKEQEELNTAQ